MAPTSIANDPRRSLKIQTHYYKIAHIKLVSYLTYGPKDDRVDLSLLELEVEIRSQHPRILITYYNKQLYHFKFNHWTTALSFKNEDLANPESGPECLENVYQELTLKQRRTVAASKLANPARARASSKKDSQRKEDSPDDEILPFASLSLLKAVKKSLMYNLSLQGDMVIFGNCAVGKIKGTEYQYRVTQIDPILLTNGDIIVSLTQRNSLILFHSSILHLEKELVDFKQAFVVYVIPSGLRCHLYDTTNILASFTHTPPKGSESLTRLLELSTGIKLSSDEDLIWVKLIPNLQHLNNQTSKISKFIHNVDNKKYILWPWKLCLLQFGSSETLKEAPSSECCADPTSLIADFLQFSLNKNEESNQKTSPELPQNSSLSINTATPKPFMPEEDSRNPAINTFEQNNSVQPPKVAIDYGKKPFDSNSPEVYTSFPEAIPDANNFESPKQGNSNAYKDDGGDEDDLFGDSSDLEKPQNLPNEQDVGPFTIDEERSIPEGAAQEQLSQVEVESDRANTSKLDKTEEPQGLGVIMQFDFVSSVSHTPKQSTIIDIPRDQMISQTYDSETPSSYEDPGAPPPLAPTPIIPQHSAYSLAGNEKRLKTLKISRMNNNHGGSKFKSPAILKDDANAELNLKYMFSPIIFNPKIKDKLDTKYDKGGKFYVERETGSISDGDSLKSSLGSADRKTSIFKNDENAFGTNTSYKTESSVEQPQCTDMSKRTSWESGTEDQKEKADKESFNRKESENSDIDPSFSVVNRKRYDEVDDDSMIEDTIWPNEQDRFHASSSQDASSSKKDDSGADDEDEDDEESDVDEDFPNSNSPLKLNIQTADNLLSNSTLVPKVGEALRSSDLPSFGLKSFSGMVTPSSVSNRRFFTGDSDSPQDSLPGQSLGSLYFSPMPGGAMNKQESQDIEDSSVMQIDEPPISQMSVSNRASPNTPGVESQSEDSESSNCLPLIHRSINVFSIPSVFIVRELNNDWDPSSSSAGFAIDVDEEEDDDFLNKDSGLSVNGANIEQFLYNLTPNLTFDFGTLSINSLLSLKLPELFNDYVIEDTADASVSEHTLEVISSVFPLNYRIDLGELVSGDEKHSPTSSSDESEETKNQLSFLDEIVDGSLLESSISNRSPLEIYWDTLAPNTNLNRANFQSYCESIEERHNQNSTDRPDEESVFLLDDVKAKVLKNDKDVINLNFVGTQFWKYLNFCPINGPKKFQVLLVTENDSLLNNGRVFESSNPSFLELLKYNFRNSHLGNIKRLHLPIPENRPDLDGLSNGLMLVDKQPGSHAYVDFYKKVNKRLKNLAELIKLDLINKSNRFEFDRPLLLLFVNFDKSIRAVSQIAKICRNFQLFLNNHQLPLVDVFSHIIPSDFVAKKVGSSCRLKFQSDLNLSRLSLILYNKCPEVSLQGKQTKQSKCVTRSLYTQLVPEPPSALHFKVLNKINREGSSSAFYDDLFLHVAYERSVDKEWILAAWSDPFGAVTFVKSWYCQGKRNDRSQDGLDLGIIINDIWSVSSLLFAKLNEDPLQRTFGSGKKKYLVLTRISSIIPDDELIHWKRLTTKDKEISLVVLSTNRLPKVLFQLTTSLSTCNHESTKMSTSTSESKSDGLTGEKAFEKPNSEFIKSFEGVNTSPTNGFSLSSPLNAGVGSQSPGQFLNSLGNILSPLDMGGSSSGPSAPDPEQVVKAPFYDILAVLPRVALPSFNSPTRLGMLIGYLLKETTTGSNNAVQKYMVFEVTLLSCSAYWNLRSLMKILLNHYKKLIVLNEIIGTHDSDCALNGNAKFATDAELRSFVPWHISAVGKALEYLTHVNVEGGD